jgi:Flp pilus assembly protein TadB
LSLTPFILFALITLISPDYFFGVKDHPIAILALIVGGLLLVIGNVTLYRMVNFKY